MKLQFIYATMHCFTDSSSTILRQYVLQSFFLSPIATAIAIEFNKQI